MWLRHEQGRDPASSLCLACVDVLGVSGAGLVLMSGGRSVDFVGVSDRVSEAVEQMEYTLGEGPCVSAYRTKVPVFDADLADEGTDRWPEFRRGALAAGVRAAFGFPLLVDRICIGALNLYHDRPGALRDDQVADALVVAQFASRAVLAWQADARRERLRGSSSRSPTTGSRCIKRREGSRSRPASRSTMRWFCCGRTPSRTTVGSAMSPPRSRAGASSPDPNPQDSREMSA